MNYKFTETQKNDIIEQWGNGFDLKILNEIKIYSEKWKLYDFEFVDYYSVNAIFFCKSELYGECVLKIGGLNTIEECKAECDMLREYETSGKFCKLLECDIKNKIMLIERIFPGKRLKEEPSLEKRLAVFSELYNGLHIEPENPAIYNTYVKCMNDVEKRMRGQEDFKETYIHVLRAKSLIEEISAVYDKKALLHADLHYDNILLDSDGTYKIIDPQGVIGSSVFETGRYILNE